MVTKRTIRRAIAGGVLAVGLLAGSAITAEAANAGYKYCSGGFYTVQLKATSTQSQSHTHTANGSTTYWKKTVAGTLTSNSGWNSSNWTAATLGTWTSGPTVSCV